MIKVKLSTLGKGKNLEHDIVQDEILDKAAARVFEGVPLPDNSVEKTFDCLVNGKKIDSDFWPFTKLNVKDIVVFYPRLKGDDGVLIKSALLIGISIAANALAPGLGVAAGAWTGVFVAGATVAGSLLLNALIPTPIPSFGSDSSIEQSQVYSLTSQSNQVNKYGTVPKVYGTHRMFPTLAANPYIEIEADPTTGKLVQYLYSVYDFGYGPLQATALQIGDSDINLFEGVTYNFVDINRPDVDEGAWDTGVKKAFTLYKGVNEVEPLGIVLPGNQQDGSPIADYQAIRESANPTSDVDQSILLTFVNPTGLVAFSSTGQSYDRTILLDVQFSKEGEDNWHAYNDLNYVSEYSTTGSLEKIPLASLAYPKPIDSLPPYPEIFTISDSNKQIYQGPFYTPPGNINGSYIYTGYQHNHSAYYGLPQGSTSITAHYDDRVSVGDFFYINGMRVGRISAIEPQFLNIIAFYHFSSPTTQPFYFWQVTFLQQFDQSGNLLGTSYHLDNDFGQNFYTTQDSDGRVVITANTTQPNYATVKFQPREHAQFKIRVTRVRSLSSFASQVQDSLSWTSISTRFAEPFILTQERHLFLEVKIKATNQLNGTIQNLSSVCTSVLNVYDPDTETWSKAPTNNPAWVVADILSGDVNRRAIDKSRLDTTSLVEWADYCDEVPDSPANIIFLLPRFESNFVLDFAATVGTLIAQVAGAAQASLNIIDGKYGVLIDKKRDTPVQIFTPRNSKSFLSVRNYTAKPDALSISFIDPDNEWNSNTVTVYDDGFDQNNAVNIEDVTSFACTSMEQAWRYGRYLLATNRLRQETITIEVDFEYLVCARGDYVQITQDAMLVGGVPARVSSVSGSQITIDDGVTFSGTGYGYVYRSNAGEIKTSTLTINSFDTFTLDGDIPDVGDLIVIGAVDTIVFDCIVKSISPSSDLSATLTLVEKADGIYDAESSDTLTGYNPQLSQTSNSDLAPSEVGNLQVIDNDFECFGAGYQYYITIDWDPPTDSAFELFEIYVDKGQGYNLVGNTRDSIYKYIVDAASLGAVHNFKVLAVNANGTKLDLGSVTAVSATPLPKTSPPGDVESLSTDITGEVLQLIWPAVIDCDVSQYLIRYSPLPDGGSWESSVPLLRVDRNTTLASTQGRTGTYFIKAIDYNLNESVNAAVAITTIPELFGLNVIETITDFPTLSGSMDRVERDGDTLVLKKQIVGGFQIDEYYPEGFYYYAALLDLGEIYTVRIQSSIQAEGYTAGDIMSNWVTLDAVLLLANSRYSEWDVESQYRGTNAFNVMSEWATLAEIDPISEGDQDLFTPWRKFVIGDVTARILQFRLRLVSNKVSVSPRVFDGTIKADMPDRVDSYTNLFAPDTGYVLVYNPAFKGPGDSPNVQVSIDGTGANPAQSGDYAKYTDKTLEGITVTFYDKDDNPVARQFDIVVKGFGRKATSII